MKQQTVFRYCNLVTRFGHSGHNERPRGRAEVSTGRKSVFSVMKTLGFQTFPFTHETEEERKFFMGESSLLLVNSRESKLIDAKTNLFNLLQVHF